jgi:hypothetical protein
LLGGDDYRVREWVSGFQSIGEVDINDSGEEGIGEEGNIYIISRIGGMVRAA